MDSTELKHILSEFSPESGNYLKIKYNIENLNKLGFSRIIQVRGDGNCLIRSLLIYLKETRNPDIFTTILLNNHIDFDKILNFDLDHCTNCIREKVIRDWDLIIGIGEWFYHMDDSAIDGLAREAVMSLLGIDKLTIYSLLPGSDEDSVKIIVTSKNFSGITKWHATLLCKTGFCHYSALF
jgi:hypothetical protein